VLDLNNRRRTPKEVVAEVEARQPAYVGFSVKSATFAHAVDLHRKLAEVRPDLTCLYGGPHVTLSGPSILDETPPAVFFRGHAEASLPAFIDLHARGGDDFSGIQGLLYRDSRGNVHDSGIAAPTDLEAIPLPDFSRFDSVGSFTTYPLLTSRGCPYHCTYCSVPAISGRQWQARSVASVMKELEHVHTALGLRTFVVVDDNFSVDRRRAEAICQAIIDRGFSFTWSCGNGIRADRIWPGLASLMHRAGCCEVAFGVESLDEEVFGRLNKGEWLQQVKRGIEIAKTAGMSVTGFFMIGLPGSTYMRDLRTLALAQRLRLNNYYFGLTVPYPGTQLWDWAQREARFLVPWQNSYHISEVFREGTDRAALKPVFDTPGYTAEQRSRLFSLAQRAKTRHASRTLRAVERRLRLAPGYPVVVLRTSRRIEAIELFARIGDGHPHLLLWTGRGEFLETLAPALRDIFKPIEVPGDGTFRADLAKGAWADRLRHAVVVFDVPTGSLERYQNVLDFARALDPVQVVALVGDRLELLSCQRQPAPRVSRKVA